MFKINYHITQVFAASFLLGGGGKEHIWMLWGRHGVIHGIVGGDAMKKTGCKGQTLNLCKVDIFS